MECDMWKNNSLYFDSENTADSFDKLQNDKKTDMFLKRIRESYLDIAKEIDSKEDVRYGFASILLSCSAIEAMAKIFYPNEKRSSYRFNDFCLNELGIRNKIFSEMEIYDAYRCGLSHEGRVKKRFSVSYEMQNAFFSDPYLKIINPKIFREMFLEKFENHFLHDKEKYGKIISSMFSD